MVRKNYQETRLAVNMNSTDERAPHPRGSRRASKAGQTGDQARERTQQGHAVRLIAVAEVLHAGQDSVRDLPGKASRLNPQFSDESGIPGLFLAMRGFGDAVAPDHEHFSR
jgi:hypothetical protein